MRKYIVGILLLILALPITGQACNKLEAFIWYYNFEPPYYLSISGDQITDWYHATESAPDANMQTTICNSYALPDAKIDKISEIKAEGLRRIQLIYPSIDSFDQLQFEKDKWQSIAPAARQATVDFQKVIDIYQVGVTAIGVVNGYSTEGEVIAYDVINNPNWP